MPILSKFQGITMDRGSSFDSAVERGLNALGLDLNIQRHEAELDALWGTSFATAAHFQAIATRFVAIINNPLSVTGLTIRYLTTEGGRNEADMDGDGTLSARHLLYWLDRKIKEKKGVTLAYTNRLSELGGDWGEAEPDSLTEADPLDLVTFLEGLDCKVVIVDNDADEDGPNNLLNSSTTGFVRLDRNGTTAGVRCIDNVTAKTNANRFSGSNFLHKAWKTLNDVNERNGGGLCFPNDPTVESIMLVRASVLSDHVVESENQIGVRIETQTVAISGTPTSGSYQLISSNFGTTAAIDYAATAADVQAALRLLPDLEEVTVTSSGSLATTLTHTIAFHGVTMVANPATLSSSNTFDQGSIGHAATQSGGGQNTRITITGYPGELPEVHCGNSANNEATPTECPNTALAPTNGTATIFRIGQAATQYRSNFHFRNLHFHGKRETAGGAFFYCGEGILKFIFGKNCSVRLCKFTDLQPVPDDYAGAGTFTAITDLGNSVRDVWDFNGVFAASPDFVFDSNDLYAVDPDSYPNAANSDVATISTSDDNGGQVRFNTTGAHGLTSGGISVSGHSGFTGSTKLGYFAIDSVTATTITTTAGWTGTGGTGGTLRVQPVGGKVDGAMLDADGAERVTITRNRFKGFKGGGAVRCVSCDGATIEDNIIEGYNGSSLFCQDLTNFAIRRNRIGPFGAMDYAVIAAGAGGHGIQLGYSSDGTIEDNVIFAIEPTSNVANFGIWFKGSAGNIILSNITVRRNLLYRCGMFFDDDSSGQSFSNLIWSSNLLVGMTEMHKTKQTTDDEVWTNAQIMVRMLSVPANEAGTLNDMLEISGNYLWRFDNLTPRQVPMEIGPNLGIRDLSDQNTTSYYTVDDALEGWRSNVAYRPEFVGNPEWVDEDNSGDFRLTIDPIRFAEGTPFTQALSQAWEAD